jgi:ATP-dependent Clp protease adaptor protein ClpS
MRTKPVSFPDIAAAIKLALPYREEEEDLLTIAVTDKKFSIVIYNDDVNTFEWVIRCLVELCGHERRQAEQCAWLIHSKGKYAVKRGSFDDLAPVCQALCDRGLSATLEENE